MLLLFLGGVWAWQTPVGVGLLKSTRDFQPVAGDERVRFEPAAQEMGQAIAAYLDTAVSRVEDALGTPFEKPFSVFACATQSSLNEFIAMPPGAPIRGTVRFGAIFIAPSAFDWEGADVHRESLTHELTHLHLRQRLGTLAYLREVPPWFHEAIADLVSGAGGEGISPEDASDAIREGRALLPDSAGSILGGARAGRYGLPGPMLHRQARMFIEFLQGRDPRAFRLFITALQDERTFAGPFRTHFGGSVPDLWAEFIATLP
jgi:hypothetical protein